MTSAFTSASMLLSLPSGLGALVCCDSLRRSSKKLSNCFLLFLRRLFTARSNTVELTASSSLPIWSSAIGRGAYGSASYLTLLYWRSCHGALAAGGRWDPTARLSKAAKPLARQHCPVLPRESVDAAVQTASVRSTSPTDTRASAMRI
jgi:hypothetical protein